MKREDIEHLAKLSRIALSDAEAEARAHDITSILGYVSEIESLTGSTLDKSTGPHVNVMRDDTEPHAPNLYTEDLLREAPHRHGQYIKVKRILTDKS